MTEIGVPLMLEGQLGERPLSDVLLELGRHDATGILTIQGDTDILAISLFEGGIVSTDSLNRTLEEGLGEVLEQEGWVTPDAYSSLASEYRSGGGRVVDLLVERGYLTERQLGAAMRQHIYRLGLDAFRWSSGEYKFYAGDEVSYEECVRPIPVEEFVVRASIDLGSAGPLDGGVPDPDSRFQRVADLPPMKDENALAEPERWLLHELAESRSVAELTAQGDHSEYEVIFYLWRLHRRGVLERLDGGLGEAPASSSVEVVELPRLEVAPAPEPPPELAFQPILEPILEPPVESDLAPAPSVLSGAFPEPFSEPFSDSFSEPIPEIVAPIAPLAPPEPAAAPRGGEAEVPAWEAPVEEDSTRAERRRLEVEDFLPWVSRGFAALGGLLLVGAMLFAGDRASLPFPWQSGARADIARLRQASEFLRLDEAMRTYFLLNGRFPDDLVTPRAEGWLEEGDTLDPNGNYYAFSATTSTFVIQATTSDIESGDDPVHTGSITGNFLLDPDLAAFSVALEPPLVLLD